MALETGHGRTPPNKEMALQSRRNIWPMTRLSAGQVTEMEGARPITEQPRGTDQKCWEGGHIRRPSDQGLSINNISRDGGGQLKANIY
jgi:hypothetical protein